MHALISVIMYLLWLPFCPKKKPLVHKTDSDYILFGELDDSAMMNAGKKKPFNPGSTLKPEE